MNIPEGFTPRGEGNEQPPATYDKRVLVVFGNPFDRDVHELRANAALWKVPDGPLRIVAYRVLP